MGVRRFLHAVALAVFAILGLVAPAALRAAPPPLSVYGRLPGVERIALSPSGDRVAMVGVVEDVRRLVVIDRDRKPLFTLPLQDAKIRGLYWAGEDRVLVFRSATTKLSGSFITDQTELFAMTVVPLDGGKMWSVFAGNPKIGGGVRRFLGIRQRDGHYYGYFGGITYGGDFRSPDPYLKSLDPDLYEVDLRSQQTRLIAPRLDGGYRDWAIGPDGKVLATLDYTSRLGTWVIRNDAGQRIGEGANPLGRIDMVGLGARPGTLIFSEQPKGAEPRWFEVPLAGGERKEVFADTRIDAALYDPKSRMPVGLVGSGDSPAYQLFDPYRQRVVTGTLKAFPGMRVELEDWNDRFDRLVVVTEGVGDPQTWWLVDIKTGKAEELGFSYPIGADDVGPMRMIGYKAADGTPIDAVLTLPPTGPRKNLPVVILPHGGPAARDYPGFDWWAQAFASRGYAVLQPNFRGSTGYGDAFQRAGHGQWGRAMQSDLSDGLAFLAAQGIADPKRACIVGASYGGYAALAGVTLQKGLYRCAVAVAGVSDLARLAASEISGAGYDPTMKRAIEDEIGVRPDLRPVSPISFAARADAPILLIHGKDDIVVPYEQSVAMAAALRKAGKPVEFVTLPGEDHWLSRSETRLAMLEATLRFVEAHNPS